MLTASSKYLLVVAPALGVKSLADLIALAKARPGQLNFSSAGVGSGTHFAGEQVQEHWPRSTSCTCRLRAYPKR